DDEDWDLPDPKQPEAKSSVSSFSIAYLKLIGILATAQRTVVSHLLSLYPCSALSNVLTGARTAVAELDFTLTHWLASIPPHLRWDPDREDEPFATQSASLYASYYHVQIQIHRSFIPSPINDAPLSSTFPSLAICANSARSYSHVIAA
ncbi:hypothetical protein K438DRAFT_1529803, partial [Mycena galopus ATCC 62051]